jgi:hypothetical protein
MTPTSTHRRNLWRSIAAVFFGFLAVVVLSLGTDEIFHMLLVYPPWNEPMRDPGLNLLALSYRIVYTVMGGYITARLAPRNPMRHVWVLAGIGLVMGVAGVIATSGMDLGPTLVSDRDCGHGRALHLAWRSSIANGAPNGRGDHARQFVEEAAGFRGAAAKRGKLTASPTDPG